MSQLHILKGMIEKIIRAIQRSQMAYERYKDNKLYYQALRIYRANVELYDLLNEFLYECENHLQMEVINYLFHLEDWFEQFKELETTNPMLGDRFVFKRFKDSPSFPNSFIQLISK